MRKQLGILGGLYTVTSVVAVWGPCLDQVAVFFSYSGTVEVGSERPKHFI